MNLATRGLFFLSLLAKILVGKLHFIIDEMALKSPTQK